ncbi:hypothetical protein CKM354_000355000 [Cercospora kikuchii]|uniref:PHD-type domain-containing protein n=1 Tax=Cercospora kikuchii TaxID=84275 RepID=A0A9P3CKK1_9PEZI|nr:uncharacterized protein CKM354_000355000 [Cercospora kikuchii]GIZ40198.1 hypothetical protein CKM354_000355000 [Cercospora kikuchii]
MVKLPEHHVLNYFYDNDGGCALTTLVHHERYHVIVDPKDLKDRSKAGKKIREQYQRLLQQVQAEASGDDATHQTAPLFVQEDEDEEDASDDEDSGVDVSSRSASTDASEDENEHDVGPPEALQRWMLRPLASTFKSNAPKQKAAKKQRTVQEWFHCPTHYYHLTISSGKLSAVEDSASESLTKRTDQLIPTINLPKYIQKLNVPSFAASEITVIDEAEGPAETPIHPTLVERDGKRYFLKAVNNAEPGPTKREIQIMKKLEAEGLHNELRVPLLRGLVHFDDDNSKSKMMGFLMDCIEEATPLTKMLSTEVPEEKRNAWAQESARMVDLLHQHDIIWGDSKGDNFMVDKHDDLWIIDFGGSYTEGWVDPELKDSEEGDDQGVRRLVNGLKDPENNTVGDEEEECNNESEEVARMQHQDEHLQSLKRKHKKSEEEEQEEANERAAKQQKRSGDKVDDDKIPFEEGKTVESTAAADNADDDVEMEESGTAEEEDEESSAEPKKTYCYCNGPDSGRMLACDGEQCKKEWFHFECLGFEEAPESKKWYCDDCLIVEEWKSMHFNVDRN